MNKQDHESSFGDLILDRFIQKNPLAAGLRLVLEQLFASSAINEVFEAHAIEQYTRQIAFASIVEIMAAVVTGRAGSVHAALQKHGASVGASLTAFYNKLNGAEPAVSAALVQHSAERARGLLVQMGGQRAERLPGWRLRILDGNHLACTERRLRALSEVAAGPLPGFCLVAFDPTAMLMTDVIPCEDGHAQERSLTAQLLEWVQQGDCWIADRNFCTLAILFGIMQRHAAFVIRQHANLPWEPVGVRRARGRVAHGAVYEQDIRLTFEGETRIVRRVTVVLDKPTRDGDPEVHVLSPLPANKVTAAEIADLYLGRWTIESAFADLARWLDAELAPLGYPRAALLGFCVGMMAYNAISTLLGALRAVHGEAVVQEQVSGYYIAQFGREAIGSIDDLVEEENWRRWRELPLIAAAMLLKKTAARIDLATIRKARRGPKKPVPARTRFKNKTHVSTRRLLDGKGDQHD